MTRNLIKTTETARIYEILNGAGEVVGRDEEPISTPEQINETTINDRLDSAMASFLSYEALVTPSTAQTVAVVKLLCRVERGLIRLQKRQFDSAN